MKEISAAYEQQSGDKVRLNFDASNILTRQIEEGAPADVFLSADEARMDALEKAGYLAFGTRKTLLSNTLVIVVPFDGTLKINSPPTWTAVKSKKSLFPNHPVSRWVFFKGVSHEAGALGRARAQSSADPKRARLACGGRKRQRPGRLRLQDRRSYFRQGESCLRNSGERGSCNQVSRCRSHHFEGAGCRQKIRHLP